MKFLLLILIVTANADGNIHANPCQLEESGSKLVGWNICECSEPFEEEECTDKEDTVCGSDGKKYKNRCHLLTASCKNGGRVFETDDRPTTCKVHDCPKTALRPVCAYTGTCSSQEECMIKNGGDKNETKYTFLANPCLMGNYPEYRIRLIGLCDCDIHGPCPPDKTEVCGNDKKMYKNRCHLIHSHCKNPKSNLREVPTKCCKTQDKTSSVDCL